MNQIGPSDSKLDNEIREGLSSDSKSFDEIGFGSTMFSKKRTILILLLKWFIFNQTPIKTGLFYD